MGALVALVMVFILAAEFGWIHETLGLALTSVAAVIVSIMVGICLRRAFYINLVILSIAGGMVVGVMIYSVVCVAVGWESIIFLLAVVLGFGALSGYIGWKVGKQIVVITSALIGAYMVTRGIAAFFSGFPDRSDFNQQIKIEDAVVNQGHFAIALPVFIGSFFIFFFWQRWAMDDHEMLLVMDRHYDEYQKA